MSTMDGLKPCPFCEGKARMELRWAEKMTRPVVHIVCTECGCIGKGYDPEVSGSPTTCAKLARDWWNTRNG